MGTEENVGPRRATLYRIIPQLKTFKKGALLKSKIDLYYSMEEDILETGGEDNFSAIIAPLMGGQGGGASFPQSGDFLHKDMNLLFVEAAQFRADDNNVYVRAQLLSGDKVVWVNVLKTPNRLWAFKIRSEQKALIKTEIEKMFEVLLEG